MGPRNPRAGLWVSDAESLKRKAAQRAVDLIEDGMRLGLGSGSTARHVLEVIAERSGSGELRDIVGVPTSRATEAHARGLGIPLATLDEVPRLDLTLDGADEVDPNLDLVKGLGGALLWEKIVASASHRLVIVVDERKLVQRLGTRAPLPVEVVPFGWRTHLEPIEGMGAQPTLRAEGGSPFRTDSGNYILDCRFPDGLDDAAATERALRARIGVVETGLFIGMASVVVVARHGDVEVLERRAAT